MLISTCFIIFISASFAKESKDKRSVAYPYQYETNDLYGPRATNHYDYHDYDTKYAVQRPDHRSDNFLIRLRQGMKGLVRSNRLSNRQDGIFGGSVLGDFVLFAVPMTALGLLLVFNNDINNLFTTTSAPATAAPVAAFNPCATKVCEAGLTCNGGSCVCGTSTFCDRTIANVCSGTTCVCGSTTNGICKTGSTDTQTRCFSTLGVLPTFGDTTAKCMCTGTGTSDTCLKASTSLASVKKPLCGTGLTVNGLALGECGKCSNSPTAVSEGNGMKQGTCTDSTQMCKMDGSCMCQVSAKDGDGTTIGSCSTSTTTADTVCMATGKCQCRVCATNPCSRTGLALLTPWTGLTAGTTSGDGKQQGTCAKSTHRCKTDGTCKCQKSATAAGDGDGTTTGTCTGTNKCCADGECKTAC